MNEPDQAPSYEKFIPDKGMKNMPPQPRVPIDFEIYVEQPIFTKVAEVFAMPEEESSEEEVLKEVLILRKKEVICQPIVQAAPVAHVHQHQIQHRRFTTYSTEAHRHTHQHGHIQPLGKECNQQHHCN